MQTVVVPMKTLTCACGNRIHLTPGRYVECAGELLWCPRCGMESRVRPARPIDIVRYQESQRIAKSRPRRRAPEHVDVPTDAGGFGFVAVLVAISLAVVKLGGLLLLLAFGHFGAVLLGVGLLLMLAGSSSPLQSLGSRGKSGR